MLNIVNAYTYTVKVSIQERGKWSEMFTAAGSLFDVALQFRIQSLFKETKSLV